MKKLSALIAMLFASASMTVFAQATPAKPAEPMKSAAPAAPAAPMKAAAPSAKAESPMKDDAKAMKADEKKAKKAAKKAKKDMAMKADAPAPGAPKAVGEQKKEELKKEAPKK